MQKVHQVKTLVESVNETHPGLGRASAFAVMTNHARRMLLLVAPPGCGKSQITDALAAATPGSMKLDVATEAGLQPFKDQLTGFRSLVTLDDLAGMKSSYRREVTLSTLAGLGYRHSTEIHTGFQHLSITDYHGSCICGCQPVTLSPIVQSDIWSGMIADKTVRYYHIFRPTAPTEHKLDLRIANNVPVEDVEAPDLSKAVYRPALAISRVQWSLGRVLEHTSWMLRALAGLDNRKQVNKADVDVFIELGKGMILEKHILDRDSLEGPYRFRLDFLSLLIMFCTYGRFTIQTLCDEHKISHRTAYSALERYKTMWIALGSRPTTYGPSADLQEIINEVI